MSEPDVDELREQLVDAFSGANYPVSSGMDLLPTLPNGPSTTFESGDWSMSVTELQRSSGNGDGDGDGDDGFPYDGPEALADDVIEGLRDAGEL